MFQARVLPRWTMEGSAVCCAPMSWPLCFDPPAKDAGGRRDRSWQQQHQDFHVERTRQEAADLEVQTQCIPVIELSSSSC